MTDVDAITERLNGLVNLLNVVGIDGVDPSALLAEQKKLSKGSGSNSTPTTQSSDSQIIEIIKKLQQAQADSPQILEALKSPELRALAMLAAQKSKPEPKKPPAPSLEDVMDDDDNYPKIGPGYSDDISVVSDLSTPTVMTKQNVPEEEYYKDVNGGPGALPPMHIGVGGSQPARPSGHHAPKKKNLVSSVSAASSRRAIAKTGGAAAQRRLNYQQAMAKLQSNDFGSPEAPSGKKEPSYMENFSPKKPAATFYPTSPTMSKLPSELPSLADQGKKKQTKSKSAVKEKKGRKTALAAQEEADVELDYDPMAPKFDQVPEPSVSGSVSSSKKRREKPAAPAASAATKDIDWGRSTGGSSGWPSFDEGADKKDSKVFVDNDGFFSNNAFGSGSDPFGSGGSTSGSKRSKEDSKPRKPRREGEERSSSKKDKTKKTKGRRASLTM
eukprot:Nitzschia sp. Nitz4//scaffold86_size83305//708//2033//NITZ4_005246-RA/size83305-processed-gene-0.0-mRNA-1//1//CDS//3329559202//6652//frame0